MCNIKEELISSVTEKILLKYGRSISLEIRDLLVIELKDIEFKKATTDLIVIPDERANIIRKFIACKTIAGLTKRSLKAYLEELKRFFLVINKNIKDVTTDDIRIYLATGKKTASDITIDNRRRYLNSFFDWCFTEEIIEKNPVKKIEKIRTEKKEKEAFTDLEIETMRNELINSNPHVPNKIKKETKYRNIAIFETLLSTGLRCAELANLKKNMITEGAYELVILGKGKKERKIYLNAKSKIALANYIGTRKDNNEWLFISYGIGNNQVAQKISEAGIEKIIRELGKKCEIKAYPHKFRRTTATMAVKKGMPIEQVQKMLGHSSLNTTQIYVNVDNEEVKVSHQKYFN